MRRASRGSALPWIGRKKNEVHGTAIRYQQAMNRPHAALFSALRASAPPAAAVPTASEEADSASDSEPEQNTPLARLMQQQQEASDADDGDESGDAEVEQAQPATAAVPPPATAAVPAEEERGAPSGLLPSADDLERLAAEEGAFLAVANPAVEMDAAWSQTPFQQRTAAAAAAEADAAKALGPGPSILPSFRYGRGMNALQLGVELSARAAGYAPGNDARGSKNEANDRKNAGKAKGEFKRRSETSRGRDGDERKRARWDLGANEACSYST